MIDNLSRKSFVVYMVVAILVAAMLTPIVMMMLEPSRATAKQTMESAPKPEPAIPVVTDICMLGDGRPAYFELTSGDPPFLAYMNTEGNIVIRKIRAQINGELYFYSTLVMPGGKCLGTKQ